MNAFLFHNPFSLHAVIKRVGHRFKSKDVLSFLQEEVIRAGQTTRKKQGVSGESSTTNAAAHIKLKHFEKDLRSDSIIPHLYYDIARNTC